MADENVQVKISGDGSGAIRALAAVATEQAKLTGQQIAHQKTLGAGDAEITALQKQQNLQLERAWKLRQQAAQVSFEASGDSSTKARENLQIEQERLAVKTAQVASERAAAIEAAKVAEATRRAAEEAERAGQAARVRAAQDRAGTADSRVGLAASRVELAQAQGAAEERVTQLLAAQRSEQERAWRLQMQAVQAEGNQAAIAQTRIRIQTQINSLAAEEARRRAEAAKAGTYGGRLGALGAMRAQMAGSPADLAGGLREAEAAATRLGGGLAGVNERMLGLKAGREQIRGLYSEIDRLAVTSLRAGVALAGIGLAMGAALVKSSVGLSSEREAVVNGLKAIMGSAGVAEAHLKDLKKAAGLPGVNLDGAIRFSVGLQGVHQSAEMATRASKALGNSIALMGKGDQEFSQAARQLTQIAGAAQLTQEDINSLRDAGLPIAAILEDAFGTNRVDEIQKLGLSGREAFERIIGAMEQAPTAAGGLKNALENLKIGWTEIQVKFGDGLKAGNLQEQGEALTANLEKLEKVAYDAGKALAPLIEKAVELAVKLTENDGALLKVIGTFAAWGTGLLLTVGMVGKLAVAVNQTAATLKLFGGLADKAPGALTAMRGGLSAVTSAAGAAGPALAALAANPLTWAVAAAVAAGALAYKMSGLGPAAREAQESLDSYNQAVKEAAENGLETKAGPEKLAWWDHLANAIGWTTKRQREFNEAMADGVRIRERKPQDEDKPRSRPPLPTAGPDLKGAAGVEERRLNLARERLALAVSEGAAWEQQKLLWAEIEAQQERVWRARLQAAEKDAEGLELEQAKLAIEAERIKQTADRNERESAHQKDLAESAERQQKETEKARKEEEQRERAALAGAQAIADLKLGAAVSELEHAERMGASAQKLEALEASTRAAREASWKAQLAAAEQQVRAGEDALALAKAHLEVDQQRKELAEREAEQRRQDRLATLSAEQRLAQMAADRAGKLAEHARKEFEKSKAPADQAALRDWQGQQAAWQKRADNLALQEADARDPRGVNKAVEIELAEQAGRKLDEAIRAEEEADRAAEAARREKERLAEKNRREAASAAKTADAERREQARARVREAETRKAELVAKRAGRAAIAAADEQIRSAQMAEARLLRGQGREAAAAGSELAAAKSLDVKGGGRRRESRLQDAVIGGDLGQVQDILTVARRAGGGRRGDPLLEAIRNPNTQGLYHDISEAMAERDRRQRETSVDAVRGRI